MTHRLQLFESPQGVTAATAESAATGELQTMLSGRKGRQPEGAERPCFQLASPCYDGRWRRRDLMLWTYRTAPFNQKLQMSPLPDCGLPSTVRA